VHAVRACISLCMPSCICRPSLQIPGMKMPFGACLAQVGACSSILEATARGHIDCMASILNKMQESGSGDVAGALSAALHHAGVTGNAHAFAWLLARWARCHPADMCVCVCVGAGGVRMWGVCVCVCVCVCVFVPCFFSPNVYCYLCESLFAIVQGWCSYGRTPDCDGR
jgi:hypothetical protein